MLLKEHLDKKINQHLNDFSLACSDVNLKLLKTTLEDNSTFYKIREILDRIESSYAHLSSFFNSSNHKYVYSSSPDLMLIHDIRYCIPINRTHLIDLNNLIDIIMIAAPGTITKININVTISLVTFLEIINSALIIFHKVIRNEIDLIPTREEIEEHIHGILDKEKQQASSHLPDTEKELLVIKYLVTLSALDSQSNNLL